MKSKLSLFCAAIVMAAAIFTGCKTPTKVDGSYAFAPSTISCLGTDGDGTQTLRAFGKGNNKAQAIEQAKRNAVNAVIFKGITDGSAECNKRPLINEVNARERYETYFDSFFANNGAYSDYVVLDEKRTSRIQAKNTTQEQWGVVVTVNRPALRQRLIEDGILKP